MSKRVPFGSQLNSVKSLLKLNKELFDNRSVEDTSTHSITPEIIEAARKTAHENFGKPTIPLLNTKKKSDDE